MENIILIGHGSPKEGANNMDLAARLLHTLLHPDCEQDCVQVAYLQFARPEIAEAIDAAIARGAKRIILHPFFLSAGIHVSRDIPELIASARVRYPQVEFIYTEPLGIHQKIAEVVRERILAARGPKPGEIESRSFSLIAEEADFSAVPPLHLSIIQRVIHATADFEFKNTLLFHPDAVKRGLEAIRSGRDIAVDVEMVRAGINKNLLAPWGGKVICRLPEAAEPPETGAEKTRAERGIAQALTPGHNVGIIAIGNAPTALLKAIDLLSSSGPADFVPLVVGVPVGFVQALEAKALLAQQQFPFITNLSRKGGSPVAVAIVNALLKMAQGDQP